jgi:hypothetical protein
MRRSFLTRSSHFLGPASRTLLWFSVKSGDGGGCLDGVRPVVKPLHVKCWFMQAKVGRSSGSAAILKVNSGLFQPVGIDTIDVSSGRLDWPRSDCEATKQDRGELRRTSATDMRIVSRRHQLTFARNSTRGCGIAQIGHQCIKFSEHVRRKESSN